MTTWSELAESAPRIATIFSRRHAAAGNLCMLATTSASSSPVTGSPRPCYPPA